MWAVLDAWDPDCVIEGTAKGADSLAWVWAGFRRKGRISVFPKWKTHGRRAGMLRNLEMIERAQEIAALGRKVVVIAFLDEARYGPSKGTKHCMAAAAAAGFVVVDAVTWMDEDVRAGFCDPAGGGEDGRTDDGDAAGGAHQLCKAS